MNRIRLLPPTPPQALPGSGLLVWEATYPAPPSEAGGSHLRSQPPPLALFSPDVHCPRSRGWRAWKDKCLFLVLDVALEWSQAQRFCQRFHGGSLLSLNSPQDLVSG